MEEDKVLKTVTDGLKYSFFKDLLVKPLDPIKVTKEVTEQIPTGEVDENGYNKYDTNTETKEVDSEWSIGIVIALPSTTDSGVKLGDKIVYNKKFAKDFDLFKTSQLVKPYDVIALKND